MRCRTGNRTIAYTTMLVVASVLFLIMAYNASGVYWDFVSHILEAKSLLNPAFYSAASIPMKLNTAFGKNLYFEPFRAPLSSLAMVPFLWLGKLFIPAYLAFLVFFLGFALVVLSGKSGIDPLLLGFLFFTPYVLFYLTLLNGTEIFTMALILIAVGYVIERRSRAGFFMALACLAKYTTLAFLPLLLLSGGRRKIAESYAIFGLTTLPWLAFNWIAFGNPFYSYLSSAGTFGISNAGIGIASTLPSVATAIPVIAIWLVPALAVIALASHMVGAEKKAAPHAARGEHAGQEQRVAMLVFALGAAGWLALSYRDSLLNMQRFGYLIYIGVALLMALGGSEVIQRVKNRHAGAGKIYAALLLSSLLMVGAAYVLLVRYNVINEYGTTNPEVINAVMALQQNGLSGCGIVSNGWVYLRFYGIEAYPPYLYNSTISKFPILAFKTGIGVSPSEIKAVRLAENISYGDFYVEIPEGSICG